MLHYHGNKKKLCFTTVDLTGDIHKRNVSSNFN